MWHYQRAYLKCLKASELTVSGVKFKFSFIVIQHCSCSSPALSFKEIQTFRFPLNFQFKKCQTTFQERLWVPVPKQLMPEIKFSQKLHPHFCKSRPVHCSCPSDIFEDCRDIFKMDHFFRVKWKKWVVIFLKKLCFFGQKQWHISDLRNPLR